MKIYAFVVEQGYIISVMICLGIGLGFFYDLIRVVRRLFHVSRLMVDVSDVIYWLLATAFIWRVQNEIADGVIRFCQLFAVAIAMVLYYSILSPLVVWLFYTPLHFVGKLFARVYRYINRRLDAVLEKVDDYAHKIKKKVAYEKTTKQTKKNKNE